MKLVDHKNKATDQLGDFHTKVTGRSLYLVGVKIRGLVPFRVLKSKRFWYLLWVLFKISDDHPRHFYMGVPPPGDVPLQLTLYISLQRLLRRLSLEFY